MTVLKVPVSSEDHVQGDFNAPITLVEYGDYQCPYCGKAYPMIKQIQDYFGDQLRFVFRNFPLAEVHQFAKPAAITAEYADTFNKFWEMHDLIYENQDALSEELLLKLTKTMGLDTKDLIQALQKNTFEKKLQKDFMGGVRSGVNGTPSFFINDQRYTGPYEYKDLVQAIESVFAK